MNDVILLCSEDNNTLKDVKLDEKFDFNFITYPIIIDTENEIKNAIEYIHENQINGNGFIIIKERYENNEIMYVSDVFYMYNNKSDTWSLKEINNVKYKILFKQILNYLNRIE